MNKKQLEKMLRLADVKKPLNESLKTSAIELIKSAADGNTYAIVRENRTYYIMKTETKTQLTENDFDYIGGLQNRTKNSFRAFDDAVSRLNLMFNDINRERRISESVDMKTFDYVLENGVYVSLNEREQLEEKKFVLKQPKPKKKEISTDFGDSEEGTDEFDFGGEGEDTEGGDEFDFGGEGEDQGEGGDEFDFGGEGEDTEGGDEFDFGGEDTEGEDTEGGDEFDFDTEGGDEEMDLGTEEGGDSIKDIQRTTGKLGQQLRDTEDLSSDMQKWVAKSVISALNLDTMDDADKDDVINALESGGKSEDETPEVDFMEDEEPEWEYQGGRTFGDDEEFGPSGSGEEDDDDILLDDEGMGGYLGWEDDEEYEEIPMSQIDMPIRDKGYLNIDPEVAGGNMSYMDDELELDGPVTYMTDDDMEPCGPGVDCGEGMEEGMSKWNDADNESGMGWETNEGVSYMGDDYTEEELDRMLGNDDTYGMNNPAPVKPKEKEQAPTRPSKSPFSPPERIRPGEEPRPKARRRTDYMAEPAPSQEPSPTIAPPTTKPDAPTRPSKTPFSPPERIRPGEEPRPKARRTDYMDDDVTFE
jgi:hypothetical protein